MLERNLLIFTIIVFAKKKKKALRVLVIRFISLSNQLVDIFTKPLPRTTLKSFRFEVDFTSLQLERETQVELSPIYVGRSKCQVQTTLDIQVHVGLPYVEHILIKSETCNKEPNNDDPRILIWVLRAMVKLRS